MQNERTSPLKRRLLIAIPVVFLFATFGQSIDAKGLMRSDNASSSTANGSRRSGDEQRSERRSEQRSVQQPEQRPTPPPAASRVEERRTETRGGGSYSRDAGSTYRGRMGTPASDRPATQDRANSYRPQVDNTTTERSQAQGSSGIYRGRTGAATPERIGTRNGGDTYQGRQDSSRPEHQSAQDTRDADRNRPGTTRRGAQNYTRDANPPRDNNRDDVRNGSRGLHRRDYGDIGQIWKARKEHRDTDEWRRSHHNSGIHVDFSILPHRYNYYVYDYRPDYCFPSVYCYYYDYFPPYIDRVRVVYVPTYVRRYTYIELPIVIESDDDYYLAAPSGRSYTTALRNIRESWLRNDADRLSDYIRSNIQVAIFNRGEYAYSVDSKDFYDMTRDAMQSVRTQSMEFDRIRRRDNGQVVAYGRHIYYDADGVLKTVYISYTLERNGADWYIVEAGSSPYRADMDSQD